MVSFDDLGNELDELLFEGKLVTILNREFIDLMLKRLHILATFGELGLASDNLAQVVRDLLLVLLFLLTDAYHFILSFFQSADSRLKLVVD